MMVSPAVAAFTASCIFVKSIPDPPSSSTYHVFPLAYEIASFIESLPPFVIFALSMFAGSSTDSGSLHITHEPVPLCIKLSASLSPISANAVPVSAKSTKMLINSISFFIFSRFWDDLYDSILAFPLQCTRRMQL